MDFINLIDEILQPLGVTVKTKVNGKLVLLVDKDRYNHVPLRNLRALLKEEINIYFRYSSIRKVDTEGWEFDEESFTKGKSRKITNYL